MKTTLKSRRPGEVRGFGTLLLGGIAAIASSACCLGPLILVMLGISGSWISSLAALERYRPFLVGAALIALFFAYRRIFRPAQDCTPGEMCTRPQVKRAYKFIFGIVIALAAIAIAFPYILPFFVE